MTFTQIIFYIFGFITLLSAALVVFTKNLLYAAFCLFASLFGVAALFVFASADFLAVAQIVIYVGGILILLLFGIMLTKRLEGVNMPDTGTRNLWLGIFTGLVSFATIMFCYFRSSPVSEVEEHVLRKSTISTLGYKLLTEYVLAFELVAVLLLAALIGAAFLASKYIQHKK